MRLECLKTLRKPGAGLDHLAGCRLVALAQGIAQPELEGIDAAFLGKLVVERLMCDGALRHAEATERSGRRRIGVHGEAAVLTLGTA